MKQSYSIDEIREADGRAVAEGIPSFALMEAAGKALAREVLSRMEELRLSDVLFVCGGGNNGGDGFVAAQILHERGADVAVLCMAEKFSSDCAEAAKRFKGVRLGRIPRRRYALLVDCILGTGLRSAPSGDAAALIEYINGSGAYVVSCDLPSGLAENGIALSPCVRADLTLTVGGMKNALLLADGADTAGEIRILEIGISPRNGVWIWEAADVKALFPPKKSHSNKGGYGSVAVLAGHGRAGAPLLSVGAALKSGAGYTELWLPNSVAAGTDAAQIAAARAADQMTCAMVAAKYPACVVGIYDGEPFFSDALAYGMGAGVSPAVKGTLEALLSEYEGTLVLDADALNTLAVCGKDMLRTKKCSVVITPHIKEFSRLTGNTVEEVLADPIGLAKAFSEEYGVTVVLKNNRTVITDGTRTAVNTTGTPALAKGGSGDVLAGLLAGTCARGIGPYEAACASCYLLGRAGELAGKALGEYSVTPTDVIEFLPKAILSL